MKKSNNNTWKRIAAGALSLALVAGALPANVGGLLTGGKGIEAHAEPNPSSTGSTLSGNVSIAPEQEFEIINEPIYTFNATSPEDEENNKQYQFLDVDVTKITKIEVLVDIESIADRGWACVEWGKWENNVATRHITWMNPGIRKYTVEGDTIADATYGQVQIVGNAKLLGYNIYYGDTLAKSVHTYYNVNAPESIAEGNLATNSNDYGTVTFSQADTHNNYLAEAKSGYIFDHWSYMIGNTKHTDNGTPSDNGVLLSIPSASNPTEVKALFTKKLTPAASDFTFTAPANLNYTGSAKAASVSAAEGVTGMGTINVEYYSDEDCTTPATPTEQGTEYFVGITVTEGSDYAASKGVIHDASWKFTIAAAPTLYPNGTGITVKQGEVVLTPDEQTSRYTITNSDIPVTVSANHSLVFKNNNGFIEAAPDETALAGGTYVYTLTGAQLSGNVTILDEFVTKVDDKDDTNIILTAYNGNSESVILPASITEIATGAFECNKNVVSVSAENVTTLKMSALVDCTNLTTLNFPKLKTVEGKALLGTNISELTVLSGGTIGSYEYDNPWGDSEPRNIAILTDSENPTTRIYAVFWETYFIQKGVEIEDSGATQPTDKYRMPDNYVIFDNLNEEPVYGNQENPNEITGYKRTVDVVSTKGVDPRDYEPDDIFTFAGKEYRINHPTVTVIGSSKYAIATAENEQGGDKVDPVEEGTPNKYNLTVGEKYYLYTDSELLESNILDQKTSRENLTTFGDYKYKNRYVLSLAEGGQYKVAREYVGEVKENEPATLYIGGQTAATLKANGELYYGDQINESLVTINPLFKDVVNVNSVMLMDAANNGNPVSQDDLVEGETYYISATLHIDKDGNPETNNNTISVLSQPVKFTKRPLSECSAYLVTPNPHYEPDVEDSKDTIETPLEIVKGEGDSYSVTIPAGKFTYNSEAQTPVIKLVNSGNEEVLVTGTDYSVSGDSSKKDAGDHTFKLTAAEGSRYSSELTINWTIDQFDVSNYINITPNNNVDTDNNAANGNEAIVYDGAALDGTDYIVSTNEAYAALTDSDADKATKALVDEYLDQLKATPATDTTEAVPAKTVVAAAATNAGEYPKSEIPYPKENTFLVTPKEENDYNPYLLDCLIKSDNTPASEDCIIIMPKVNDNDESVEFKMYNSSDRDTLILVYSDGKIGYYKPDMSVPTFVDATLPNTTEYGWYIEQTGTRVLNQGTETPKTVNVFTISAKKYPTGDLKNAGEHTAKVTVTNSNFKDITQDIKTTIAKRSVTLTPDADQKITYRDTKMPDLTYSIEEAKADGLTGVVADDMALFQKTIGEGNDAVTKNAGAIYVYTLIPAEAEANAVYFAYAAGENNAKDYTKALLNNAGSYTYAAFDFDNYVVGFPKDAPTFTVDPLDISTIKDLNIVLNGGEGWTQQGNGGYYTYDGTTKQVSVASVGDKVKETAEFSADTYITDSYTAEKTFENNGVKLVSDSGYVAGDGMAYDCFGIFGDKSLTVTVPEGKTIDRIHFTYGYMYQPAFKNPNEATFKTYPNEKIISVKNVNSNTFTLSLSDGQLAITNVSVDYSSVITLNADTDYTVAGATSKASAGTFDVQVVGKGNYTGVATADWAIRSDNYVPAGLVLNFAGSNIEDAKKYYDGKAVTAEIYCINPEDTRFYDYYDNITKTEIKYYKVIRADNDQVTEVPLESAPKDAGEYKAVATIKAENYADQEITKTFSIYKAPLTVKAHKKNMFITYGNDLPAVTMDDIDSIEGLSDEDKAYLEAFLDQGKLKFAYVDETKAKVRITPSLTPGDTTEDEIEKYLKLKMNYNFDNYYWNVIHRAKSLNDSSITVEMPRTVILSENGTASPDSIKVYDTAILNENDEPTELTPGTDYTLNIEKTAKPGTYTVEIVGKGEHYRGTKKVTFSAVTAPKFTTTVNTAVNPNKPDVKYVKYTFERNVSDDAEITAAGYVYVKDTVDTLTVDTEGATVKTVATTNKTGTVGIAVPDEGNGTTAVGFIVVNGVYIYSDVVSKTYADIIAEKASVNLAGITTPKNPNKPNVNYVKYTFERNVADDAEITAAGYVYVKDTVDTLTVDTEGATVKTVATTNKTGTVGIAVPDEGNGTTAVGFVVVNGVYIYSDVVSKTHADVIAEKASVNLAGITTPINPNKPDVHYVKYTFERNVAADVDITAAGYVYVKGTVDTLTVDTDGATVKTVATTNKTGTVAIAVPDEGNGTTAVGFIVVNGVYIYSDVVSKTYEQATSGE